MWIPTAKTRRFNLYFLDQNQTYIKDFSGLCTFVDPVNKEEKVKQKGKFYLCSKSIVFEPELPTIPLLKFKLQAMKAEPKTATQGDPTKKKTQFITFQISKLTTIRVSASLPPEPYKHYDEYNCRINIYSSYQPIAKIMDWLLVLYPYSKKKGGNYELEQKIQKLMAEKENKKGFNMSLIESVSEKPLHEETNILVRRILPLNHVYGYIFVTDAKVYFQPFHNLSGKSVSKIELSQIGKLFKRRFELQEIGLEIIGTTGKSYYFTFQNTASRNRLYLAISKQVSEKCLKVESLDKITYLWQTKQISNYDYLMHLNQTGNRSFSDLSQYPVFPWVITDFKSETLDLDDTKIYRDLSKPIGALNPQRLAGFLDRYEQMPPPRFMYGSHYSAPGYVIGYLLRKKPEYMLKLQSGKFDKPDRLFQSIVGDWNNVYENPTSLKQLIPEFYQADSDFLVNKMGLDLGNKQDGQRVNDVKLPRWASSPLDFLHKMREALQSDYVSSHLHEWIDLIFGYKQHGQQAVKANNVFTHQTYEGMIDYEKITDSMERAALKCQINEFGQCPRQIFKMPHPSRDALESPSINQMPEAGGESDQQTQSPLLAPVLTKPSKTVDLSSLYSSSGKPKVKTVMSMGKVTDIKTFDIPKLHRSAITRICPFVSKPNTVITTSQDGFLKVVELFEKNCLKSFKISQVCLSAIVAVKTDEIFALGSWDNHIYLFNILSGNKSKGVMAHDNSISDLLYLTKRKRLVSSSWDCSVKLWRVVGTNLDNQTLFLDHDNQITCITADEQEKWLGIGDTEGYALVVSIDDNQKLFNVHLNNQKITRMHFLHSNILIGGQLDIRYFDNKGGMISAFVVESKNGMLTDLVLDGQNAFGITNRKHLGLYDIVQSKKLGAYFNDYRNSQQDKLSQEKELTSLAVTNQSTVVVVGTSLGNLHVLRS